MVVQQRRRGGGSAVTAVAAGALAAVVLATTGCSGGGAAAEDQRAADPVDTLHRAVAALRAAGSAKARTSMEMASGGTRVTIRGEGAYDFAKPLGRLKVMLPEDPAGVDEHRPITELLAPGALYMKNRGAGVPADKWVRIDTAGLADGNLVTGGATDPLAAAELLLGASAVSYVGETRLAGVPVRHYRGTTEIGRAAERASGANRKVLRAAAKGFAEDTVPFDAYVDDQGRLRKIRHRFTFANDLRAEDVRAEDVRAEDVRADGVRAKGAPAQGEDVVVTSTTLLSGFGTAVKAELPAAEDIFAGKIAGR
ncbi:hypothetical protein QIS99_22580 [Streptomyces sp. B-S-A8]|uniref:Lipoprotein n=1 Tax=Streptomyces solicavernae TaxID=3043614 RepID=A0ABT6RXQ3_9ACTN|nr:hypothetical protein [Streptomyces sp. B-S-A8]MDI3388959.1 hypothetical protein [Streptomyces sp. B-S-A8]